MFCGRPENEVPFLFDGMDDTHICSDCITNAAAYLDSVSRQFKQEEAPGRIEKLRKPAEIKAFLDQYVIGQERAKKLL